MLRPSIGVLLVAVLCGGCSSDPGGRIDEASKTPQCAAEIEGVLAAFKRDNGFAYEVGPGDSKAMFEQGLVSKRYARDGVRLELDFGLEATEQGCMLRLYRQTRSEPGRTTTTGMKGKAALETCTCVSATK